MKKLFEHSFILSFAAVAFLAGCGPKENVIKIAVAMPLTGDMGTEGQGVKRAVELAVEEANASGKFPIKIQAVSFDDRADPKEAVNVANLIVSDPQVAAVIGHYNSGCSIPSAQVYNRSGLLQISPASTNPKLTQQQMEASWTGPKNVFRVVPTDDVQGSFAADFAVKRLKFNRIAIVHDKSPYGQGLADEFKKRFEANGGKVISYDGIAIGDKDFKALLTRIKSNNPQAVYFGGLYMEAGLLIKQSRELGMKTVFLSGDGSKTDELFKVAGDDAEGSHFTITGIPVEDLPTAKEFIEKYKAKFPSADIKPFDHFGYEAANVVLDVISKAGADRAKIIETMKTEKFKGLLGVTEFDEKGDTKNVIITMQKVKSRKFETVR